MEDNEIHCLKRVEWLQMPGKQSVETWLDSEALADSDAFAHVEEDEDELEVLVFISNVCVCK